jgi:hypothetical protein
MSSGMPVISTMRARHSPIAPPATTAPSIIPMARPWLSTPWLALMTRAIVATSAIVMPAMPYVRPFLADSCLDSPASERMNSRAATMYAAVVMVPMSMVSAPC